MFLEEHPFWEGVVCGVIQMIIHFSVASLLPSVRSSFSLNHPGGKYV